MNVLGFVPPIIWGLSAIGLRYGLYFTTLKGYKSRINSFSSELDKLKTDLQQSLYANRPAYNGNFIRVLEEPALTFALNRQYEQMLHSGLNGSQDFEALLHKIAKVSNELRHQVKDYNGLANGKFDRKTARLLGFKPIPIPGKV